MAGATYIREYNALVDYPARRGRPKITKGTKLYAIAYNDGTGPIYFVWSYVHKAAAQVMMDREFKPESPTDIAANWRAQFSQLSPSAITPERM